MFHGATPVRVTVSVSEVALQLVVLPVITDEGGVLVTRKNPENPVVLNVTAYTPGRGVFGVTEIGVKYSTDV
jgi:hypothetical protein